MKRNKMFYKLYCLNKTEKLSRSLGGLNIPFLHNGLKCKQINKI